MFGQHLPFFLHPSRVWILSKKKLPLTEPWYKAAPGPQKHSREGSTPHPALTCTTTLAALLRQVKRSLLVLPTLPGAWGALSN